MRILALLLFLSLSIASAAQSFKDVFDEKTEITWLGLDYTAVKIVGDELGWADKEVDKMYAAWNQLMINEVEKFDIAKALYRDKVKLAINVTMEHNQALKTDSVFVATLPDSYRLSLSEIKEIVNSYDFLGNSGIGVMFIIESLDKTVPRGSLYVTFINLNNKEVLYSSRLASAPSGFGLRNYWASPIYRAIKNIQGTHYKLWRKKTLKSK